MFTVIWRWYNSVCHWVLLMDDEGMNCEKPGSRNRTETECLCKTTVKTTTTHCREMYLLMDWFNITFERVTILIAHSSLEQKYSKLDRFLTEHWCTDIVQRRLPWNYRVITSIQPYSKPCRIWPKAVSINATLFFSWIWFFSSGVCRLALHLYIFTWSRSS